MRRTAAVSRPEQRSLALVARRLRARLAARLAARPARRAGRSAATAPWFLVAPARGVRAYLVALAAAPASAGLDQGRDRARGGDPARAARGAAAALDRRLDVLVVRLDRLRAAAATRTPTRPQEFPANPALPWMGSAWLDTTTVYGPAFTLASEPLAIVRRRLGGRRRVDLQGARRRAAALAAALLAGRLVPAAGVRDRVRRLEPAPRRPRSRAAATTTPGSER